MIKTYTQQMSPLSLENKDKVHREGLWHKVFAGIVYNPDADTLYFQTIYPKESYSFNRPDYIDFGVGGHVEDEETILQAGLREIKEELGQDISPNDLHFLGIRICNCDVSSSYKIREFQYFYGIQITKLLKDMSFELCDNEVKSFLEVRRKDFIKLLSKELTEIYANEMVLDKVTRKGSYNTNVVITFERIIPDYVTDKSILEKLLALQSVIKKEI